MNFEEIKLFMAQIILQMLIAGMNILIGHSLEDANMPPLVFVTYRHVVATLVISPVAYFKERSLRPPLTLATFFKILVISFFGFTLAQSLYYLGMSYAGATYASAMSNLIPVFTFMMTSLLGLEIVDWRASSGKLKILGTVGCVGGAMIMTFYQGPTVVKSVNNSHLMVLGFVSCLVGVLFWSGWFTFQVLFSFSNKWRDKIYVLESYPALLSVTAMECGAAAIQSAILTLIFEDVSADVWALAWNIKLCTYIYSGMVGSALAFFIQGWCIERKGAVFVAVFTPVATVLLAILECVFFNYTLYLGSVIGAGVIFIGLYLVLAGKSKSQAAWEEANADYNSIGDSAGSLGSRTGSFSKQPLLL